MDNAQKPKAEIRPFLTRPLVIDWLQWGEFPESLGKLDMPQMTLSLIEEYKKALAEIELLTSKLEKIVVELNIEKTYDEKEDLSQYVWLSATEAHAILEIRHMLEQKNKRPGT